MMVKICGITNLEDAQAAVDAGASALGFNFCPESPRYITPEDAALIASHFGDSIVKVGVFVNEPPDSISAIGTFVGLNVAQLHGDESPADLPNGLRTWKVFRISNAFNASVLERFPSEAFLFDSASEGVYGGSGKTFPWEAVRGIQKKIILAGGLDATNVASAIRKIRPWGVDACSRLELSPGQKDHNKMRSFVAAALSESI
jgi:phosphoribosylanthranilate isomerase